MKVILMPSEDIMITVMTIATLMIVVQTKTTITDR